MTAKKIALRSLWHAGLYLQNQLSPLKKMSDIRAVELAVLTIANAYNEVLGEPDVSR